MLFNNDKGSNIQEGVATSVNESFENFTPDSSILARDMKVNISKTNSQNEKEISFNLIDILPSDIQLDQVNISLYEIVNGVLRLAKAGLPIISKNFKFSSTSDELELGVYYDYFNNKDRTYNSGKSRGKLVIGENNFKIEESVKNPTIRDTNEYLSYLNRQIQNLESRIKLLESTR